VRNDALIFLRWGYTGLTWKAEHFLSFKPPAYRWLSHSDLYLRIYVQVVKLTTHMPTPLTHSLVLAKKWDQLNSLSIVRQRMLSNCYTFLKPTSTCPTRLVKWEQKSVMATCRYNVPVVSPGKTKKWKNNKTKQNKTNTNVIVIIGNTQGAQGSTPSWWGKRDSWGLSRQTQTPPFLVGAEELLPTHRRRARKVCVLVAPAWMCKHGKGCAMQACVKPACHPAQ